MFENKISDSGENKETDVKESVGRRLDGLLTDLVGQNHSEEAHKMLEPLIWFAFDLIDNNAMSTEIKALAAALIWTYGEDWTASFNETTLARLRELLGE